MGAIVLVGAAVTVAAIVAEPREWHTSLATLATAFGTLALALYTAVLATATDRSVARSEELSALARDQLAELQRQRALVGDQLRLITKQAAATRDLATAGEKSAWETARARIDSISPLLRLDVLMAELAYKVPGSDAVVRTGFEPWFLPELDGKVFSAQIRVIVQNVGFSPALAMLNHGVCDGFSVTYDKGGGDITIAPGATHEAVFTLSAVGRAAVEPKVVSVGISYHGLLLGEMNDLIRWRGHIQFLEVVDERAQVVPKARRVNAGFAQVAREYTVLDNPDAIAEGRKRLLQD